VPDTALTGAELELVDLPPDELRARLAAGKVYLPNRAATAQDRFFREGNLAALRELSLRFAAEHVGQDVLAYRTAHGVADPWKSGQKLLVAVSSSPTSAALVRWTRRLAGELRAPWVAVYVEPPQPLSQEDQARLARHLALARELGAEIANTSDDDVVRGIIRVARAQNATQIVVGKPAGWRLLDVLRGGSMLNRLINESGQIDIHAVRADAGPSDGAPVKSVVLEPIDAGGYLTAGAVVAATTLVNALLDPFAGVYALALIYLLAVVVLALYVRRGPIVFAATASALLWDYFFLPPRYTLYITSIQDGMMFGMYFVVALVLGQLTAKIRAQERAERRREQHASALYQLSRELAEAADLPELLAVVIRQVGEVFRVDVALSLPDEPQTIPLTVYFASTWALSEKEQTVATWAFQHRQRAGRGTDTLALSEGLHLPLLASERAAGVLSLRLRDTASVPPAQRDLLDAFVRQIALVLDRQRLRDAETQAKLLAESERLGKTLLNSVSHELRTPLAAITSATSGLTDPKIRGDAQVQAALLQEIQEATRRLNRLVGNLLSIARLESGHIKPNMEWCDAGDLINTVVKSLANELAGHEVVVSVPPNLPLVKMDFVLMEQVLGNLLLNAVAYTPRGTKVELGAAIAGQEFTFSVADHGPGLPPESEGRIFDKFYRAPGAPAGGTGLGLSIVKGFVEAQGGRVRAQIRDGGGAVFAVTIPLTEAPPVAPETT
jgi:two-component system sensor histidine kinase KdpD